MKRFMLCIAVSVGLAACGPQEQTADKAKAVQPAGDVVAGKAVADKFCKGCHGLDGRGTAPAIPHLAAQRERYLAESIAEYKEGKRTHAALKDMTAHLSDADVRNAVAYYASLPPLATPEGKAPLVFPYERGRTLAAQCASCHGPDGNSATPGTPSLAGQQPQYFIAAIQEYHQGDRLLPAMRPFLRGAGKLELESLALYFASQTPAQRPAPAVGDPAAGEPLTGSCAGCHGIRGISMDSATPTLAGQEPQYLAAATRAYGKTRRHPIMEAQVSKLSERDILNIAAYYAVQKPSPAAKGEGLVNQLAEKCNRCHGETVENTAMVVPKLSGQDKDYLVMALRAYRDDRRESSTMHRMSLPFSDAIIDGIAALYANQPAR
ncbi:MAG: c-type cytochrome [Burkholderiales bacterium]